MRSASLVLLLALPCFGQTVVDKLPAPAARHEIECYQPAVQLEVRTYEQPRPMRVWIARVQLDHPEVRFELTPPATFEGEDKKFETGSATTLGFAEATGVDLAINTSAFGPFRAQPGQPMDVVGLAAVAGNVYSQPQKNYGALYISRKKEVTVTGPPLPAEDVWHVVPGFRMLVDDGADVVDPEVARSSFGGINPRTAVGANREQTVLWILVVDGRQKGVSMGMTLPELAALFRELGAYDALNLDGGGSTTMVIRTAEGEPVVLNTPVGRRAPGTLRLVANNLGLHLPGSGPAEARLAPVDPK